jgi:drug/metabolite transporter (DMT)-like permease
MNSKFVNWAIFILLCFIWGSSFILMKESKKGLQAPEIASLRIFSAGIVFVPFALYFLPGIPRKKMPLVILAGLFGNLLPAFCFAIAITKIDSSLAGILNSLTPICVVAISVLFYKDKIKRQKVIGVLVGFLGLCLLTLTQKDISYDNLGYSLLAVLATIMYGINVNQVAHYLKGINPVQLATVSLAFMSIPAALVLWQQGFFSSDFSDVTLQWAMLNAILLGIAASSIATVLFYMLVKRAGGLFAALVTYGVPFVALSWGFIDGEIITAMEIACLAIILIGVYLANRPAKNKE